MAFDEPDRRCRRRRAEDHLQSAVGKDADRVVEPIELEATLRRLESGPRELRDADDFEAGRRHQVGVALPARTRPVLGVVGDTEARPHAHPLTVPAMIPLTSRRWKTRNATTIGSVLTTDPAISTS